MERKADSEQQQPMSKDMDDDVQIIDEPEFEKGALQVTGEFDELVVWGHETLADASADPYVRSVEEWLQVADQVCR